MCTIRRIIRQQCIPTKLPVSPDAVSHHSIYYQQNTTGGCTVRREGTFFWLPRDSSRTSAIGRRHSRWHLVGAVQARYFKSAYLHGRRHLYCLVTTRAATPVTTPVLSSHDACSDTCILILFIPHYRAGNSPADSQGIGHLYCKLSFMRRAEL
jgi:hypothetical protein